MSTSETLLPLLFLLPPCLLSSSSSLFPLAKAGAAPNPSASAPPPSSFAEPLKKVRRELKRWCASEAPSCWGAAVSMWLSLSSMHCSFQWYSLVVRCGQISNQPDACISSLASFGFPPFVHLAR